MKNLSDEELVRLALTQAKLIPYWMEDDTRNEADLISRLARGRKAIEFVEALIKHRDNGVDLEADGRIYNLIDEYQQSCKEAADGN